MSGTKWTLKTVYDRCEEVGDCRIWQQSVNSKGYPQASIDGKGGQMVRRFVYAASGRKLRSGYVVIDTCGNPTCCEAEHLMGVSQGERLRRAYASGRRSTAAEYLARRERWTREHKTLLTMEIAREIRASTESHAELARRYGVHPKTIYSVRIGRSWRETGPAASVFELAQRGVPLLPALREAA